MITGFEEQTEGLTAKEIHAIPFVVGVLNKTCKDKPIKNRVIAGHLTLEAKVYLEPPRVRKLINHITINHMTRLPLVANSKGYYITDDNDEIRRYLTSLTDRLESIAYRRKQVSTWRVNG